jgi:hypothetical protein
MYTMALVPGYRLVFRAGERRYAYHTDRGELFRYCPGAENVRPPAARPAS